MDVWEIKQTNLILLLPIIEPQITDKTIFVEHFCGTCVVSYSVFKKHENFEFHVNDIDEIRTQFYINMRGEEKRKELYKLEESIVKNGSEEYNKDIKKILLKQWWLSIYHILYRKELKQLEGVCIQQQKKNLEK